MKRISYRILSLCLAALLLIGVCPMALAQEEAVTPTSVKKWVTSDLVSTAVDGLATGETQGIGIKLNGNGYRTVVSEIYVPYLDSKGNSMIKAGDVVRFTVKGNLPESELTDQKTTHHLGKLQMVYPTVATNTNSISSFASGLISEFAFLEATEQTDPIYGYKYRACYIEHTMTADDITSISARGFFKLAVTGQGGQTILYDYSVTNETTGQRLLQADGFDYFHHPETNGTDKTDMWRDGASSTVLYYKDDSTALTNLVSYNDVWQYRATSTSDDAYNSINTAATAHTVNADGKVAATASAGKLSVGDYSFEFDVSTQLVGDTELPLATLRAVDTDGKVLASKDFTHAESIALKNFIGRNATSYNNNRAYNYGMQYNTLALDFRVPAETEVSFEVVLYNNTDFRMRRVELLDVTAPAERNAPAVVEAINAIGEITQANYTDAKAKIESAEKALTDYVTAYGQEKADSYITNQVTLTAARNAYDGFAAAEAAKQTAAKDVMDKINAIGEVTADNYTEKLAAITAAEAAHQSYIDTYGEAASDDITNYSTLTAARTAYDTFLQADQKKQADADAVKQKITDIGTVDETNYAEKLTLIEAAETALADFEQAYGADALSMILNSADLTAAREAYNNAKAEAEKQADANTVTEKITAIGTVDETNYAEKLALIEAAETALADFEEAYGADALSMITNSADLTAAREAYNNVKAAAEQQAAAQTVNEAIEAIGTVDETNYAEKLALIEAAETLYNDYAETYGEEAASALEKASDLTAARQAYDEFIKVTFVFGDINGDNSIDASDALLALQHSVKLITLEGDQALAADVEPDDTINAADALLILQHSVDLIEVFPAESNS